MNKLDNIIQTLCPNSIKFQKLEDCCIIHDNKRKPITKRQRVAGKYPYYGANGIQDYVENYIFDGFFLLVGEDGSVITEKGTPIVTWAHGKIWVNNHAHIISEKEGVLLRYLYHYLQIVDVTQLIHGNIPKLTGSDFKNLKIVVPPLPVQAEIVRILDKFTELRAELTAELTARKKQYEYYRDRMLRFDNNVSFVALGEVAEVTKLAGFEFTSHVKYKDNGAIIALRGLNIKEGKLDLSSVKYIDDSNFEKLNRSKLYKGDMLFTYVGTIGQVAVIDEDNRFYLAPNVARIRFDSKIINSEFMRFYFQTNHFFSKQINKFLNSSSMKNLTMENIRKFIIPIPPIEQQNRLVGILSRFDKICNDISEGLPAEIAARQKQYEFYRDKLLTFKELTKEK